MVPGQAVPYARSGGHGKVRYTPGKQRNYMAVVKDLARERMGNTPPFAGPVHLLVRAEYLIPASWSKKRKLEARWKISKPDGSNLLKITEDAMNKIVYVDDSQIACITVQKVYSVFERVTITVQELFTDVEERETALCQRRHNGSAGEDTPDQGDGTLATVGSERACS